MSSSSQPPARTSDSKSLQRGSCTIAYELHRDTAATREGATTIFLHALGATRESMRPLEEELCGRSEVTRSVLVDLRGHGATATPADDDAYTYAHMRDDLLAVLATEAPSGAHLVGHSMGGQIALMAAIQAPDRVRSLVTLGAGPCREITDPRERKSWERSAGFFATAEPSAVAKALSDAAPADTEKHPELRPERLYGEARGDEIARIIRGGFFAVQSNDRECETLPVPMLVLAGALDQSWLEPSRKLAVLAPNAQLQVIDGVGHALPIEALPSCAERIRSFWDGLKSD